MIPKAEGTFRVQFGHLVSWVTEGGKPRRPEPENFKMTTCGASPAMTGSLAACSDHQGGSLSRAPHQKDGSPLHRPSLSGSRLEFRFSIYQLAFRLKYTG